jgi:predicted DNA-binding transcriptional regulator YafY
MRADRLIALIMLLQTKGKMTSRQLAKELEVSSRTIIRDMIALNTAGIPVTSEPGKEGGYSLVENFRSSLTGLTENEISALFTLGIPESLEPLGIGSSMKSALLKLSSTIPRQLHPGESTRQWFLLDSTSWEKHAASVQVLQQLYQAICSETYVQIHYRLQSRGLGVIQIAPYALVAKADDWYLIYAIQERMKVHNVVNIVQVHLLPDGFTRQPTFQLESFWREWCEQHKQYQQAFQCKVRVSPSLLPYLAWVFSPGSFQEVSPEKINADDWRWFTLSFSSFDQARKRLLSLGGSIKVIEPHALKVSLVDFARQTLAMYPE